MLILNVDKVACFDTHLEVLILKGLTLHKNCAKRGRRGSTVGVLKRTAWRAHMVRGARGCSGQAEESHRLNQVIIAYSHHLSIIIYKSLRCWEIAASKAETRKVKVETGRQRKSNPAPFVKPNPKGCATRVLAKA